MAVRKSGGELMRERSLHATYAQQLALFRNCKLQHDLATGCAWPADLMRQRAAFDEIARGRVIKLGVRTAGDSRDLLPSC